MRGVILFVVLQLVFPFTSFANPKPDAGAVAWIEFSPATFERAKREKKLVLLDLEAVWCHWCHVMHRETYADERVASLIAKHYVPVRVDQDSRPDLANRFRDYGWPATVIFSAEGAELVKRAGFVPPGPMAELLERTAKHPVPEQETAAASVPQDFSGALPAELRADLLERYERSLDREHGGLKLPKRYLDPDTIEFGMLRALDGHESDKAAVRVTLDNNLKLIDPVWGGAYQYSTHHDWEHPHYEKIISTQARAVRLYAAAYRLWGDDDYLASARSVLNYTRRFLRSDEGAFYVSQDADVVKGEHAGGYFALSDEKRRALGVPAVDTNTYARENGWMLRALSELYAATAEDQVLHEASKTADWLLKHRKLPEGGFRHGELDREASYLDDTLAAGEGLLALYAVSGDRARLAAAADAARFVVSRFGAPGGAGFLTSTPQASAPLAPVRIIDENIRSARFLNLLAHYTGEEAFGRSAQTAMRFLADPSVALRYLTEPGILIAERELAQPPLHVTIVGGKGSAEARALFEAAIRYPALYRRTEWWDRSEGAMPNPDVQYPELPRAAAFVCTDNRCSLPIFNAADIAKIIDRLAKPGAAAGRAPGT